MHAFNGNSDMTVNPAPEIVKEPLQVRIPVGVKRNFKAKAALLGLEPNELFVKVWEFYERFGDANSLKKGSK